MEYPLAWLATALEITGYKQAARRTDPSLSGPAGAIGDIGRHAFQLVCFVACGATTICMSCCAFRTAPGVCGPAKWHTVTQTRGEQGGLEGSQKEPDRLLIASVSPRPTASGDC